MTKPKDPPAPKRPAEFDRFGNEIGPDLGLGKTGEFAGRRLLVWGGQTAYGQVYFSADNPLWKAFEELGFTVTREFGAFKTDWLKSADQLWLLPSSTTDIPPLTGATIEDHLKRELALNPRGKRPFGWSDRDFLLAARSELELASSTKFRLTEEVYAAIEAFAKSGKGLCLLAGRDPYNEEANELARRLFETSVSGDYPGQRTAYVRRRDLPESTVRRFDGGYEVEDCSLLAGINFLYEGLAVGSIGPSDKLEVTLRASNGSALVTASKVPGQRAILDCGYSRYRHGPNGETSFIQRTAGSVRFAQNISAYLAGKDRPK